MCMLFITTALAYRFHDSPETLGGGGVPVLGRKATGA